MEHTQEDIANLEPTKNGFGFMHNKSIITDKFVSFSKTATKPVLDIGSAYGVASIFSLKEGASVIACDICQVHLDTLVSRTHPGYRNKLKTVLARFPNQTSFENESIHAVLLSHVLSFLDGDEIDEGMKEINNWLDAEGKLFILNYTPYHKTLSNFIPVYQKNVALGKKWPGYIKDKRQ
jgi:SAM-dependent methyltransferase